MSSSDTSSSHSVSAEDAAAASLLVRMQPRSFEDEFGEDSPTQSDEDEQKEDNAPREDDEQKVEASNEEEQQEEASIEDPNKKGNTLIYMRRCSDQYYASTGSAEKWLKVMAVGSKIPELQHIYEHEPFKSLKKHDKARYNVTAKDYIAEILRRSHFLDLDNDAEKKQSIFKGSRGTIPQPTGWNGEKRMSWLTAPEHYVNNNADEAFLLATLKNLVHRAEVAGAPQEPMESVESKWAGTTSWSLTQQCRLVHAILHDSLRNDFLTRQTALNRHQIDARNTDAAPHSYWDKVASLFEKDDFKPISSIIADQDWGDYWMESQNLFPLHTDHESFTGKKARKKFMEWMKVLKIVRANYGISGAGEDQHGRPDGGSRKCDYLLYYPPVVLYLWYHLEKAGLLDSSMNMLPSGLGVTGSAMDATDEEESSIGSSSTGAKRRKINKDKHEKQQAVKESNQLQRELVGHVAKLSEEATVARHAEDARNLRNLIMEKQTLLSSMEIRQDSLLERIVEHSSSTLGPMLQARHQKLEGQIEKQELELADLQSQLKEKEEELASLEEKQISNTATPQASNRSSASAAGFTSAESLSASVPRSIL